MYIRTEDQIKHPIKKLDDLVHVARQIYADSVDEYALYSASDMAAIFGDTLPAGATGIAQAHGRVLFCKGIAHPPGAV